MTSCSGNCNQGRRCTCGPLPSDFADKYAYTSSERWGFLALMLVTGILAFGVIMAILEIFG